jgi:signal peptidase
MTRLLAILGGTVVAGIIAVLLGPTLLGMQRYVITSGSMTGTYDRGSIVFDRTVPVTSLKAGDPITFQPPGMHELVTHRIVAVGTTPSGQPAFRTKGDANTVVDPWTFTPNGAKLPRVSGSVPYVGYVIAALDMRGVRMLVIGLPALLLAFALIAGMWREADPRRAGEGWA